MTLSSRVAPHLPSLRRYARALTGSQAAGDGHVAAMLEKLIEDVSSFPDASSDKIALFQLLSRHMASTDIQIDFDSITSSWERRTAENLSELPSRPRQAFLLAAVETLPPEEIAEVLETDEENVDRMLAEAAREISRQIATNIMIIEDEPLIAMHLQQIVENLGHSVTGIARTHEAAVKLFAQDEPRLILADIQLADGSSGLDAVNEILDEKEIAIIFVTAFPERLLTGERPEPAFLLTKPFDADMLKALISQVLFFDQANVDTA